MVPSGTLLLCGPGTLLSTIAPYAETISWIYVSACVRCHVQQVNERFMKASNVKPTKLQLRARNAQWRGGFAM